MGRIARPDSRTPIASIVDKGRLYSTITSNGPVTSVHVFSRWEIEVRRLANAFGGNYYKHGTGFTWMLANRGKLYIMYQHIKSRLEAKSELHELQRLGDE